MQTVNTQLHNTHTQRDRQCNILMKRDKQDRGRVRIGINIQRYTNETEACGGRDRHTEIDRGRLRQKDRNKGRNRQKAIDGEGDRQISRREGGSMGRQRAAERATDTERQMQMAQKSRQRQKLR